MNDLSPYITLPYELAHPDAERMGVHQTKPPFSFDITDVLRPTELARLLYDIEQIQGRLDQTAIYACLRSAFVNYLESMTGNDD